MGAAITFLLSHEIHVPACVCVREREREREPERQRDREGGGFFVFHTTNELTSAPHGKEKNIFKVLSTAYYLSVTTTVQGISGVRLWVFYSSLCHPSAESAGH